MTEKKRKGRGCLWAAVALLSLAVIGGTLLVLVNMIFGQAVNFQSHTHRLGEDEFPSLQEVWSEGSGDTKVVTVPLRGLIHLGEDNDFFGSAMGSSSMALKSIRRATHDPEIKGIILDVDSGGGGITASDILFKALIDFREAGEGRQIVALFGDVAASGGYYVALAADHIMAHPTTITGSIGVLVQSINLKGLAEKIGISDVTIKSGKNKDMLNPLRDLTEDQRAMLQEIVDEQYNNFVSLVANRRELSEEAVRRLADGRIFSASKASSVGLVDQIGYRADAHRVLAGLLGVDAVAVYRYEEEFSFSTFLRSCRQWSPASAFVRRYTGTRLMYLWQL